MAAAQRYVSLWSRVSPLGDRIEVIEQGPVIQLRVNSVWQGEMNRGTPRLLPTPYMQQMMISLCFASNLRRVLVIGLGTGCLPKALHAVLPDATIDVVEIDPDVAHIAQKFFGFPPPPTKSNPKARGRVTVHIQDGIAFFKDPPTRYDVILVDAFSGAQMPPTLRTAKTMWTIRNAMAPGGVLAMNLSRLDPFAIHDVVGNMSKLIQAPALYDPRNEERHDDLNLVVITPADQDLRLFRQRRLLIEQHAEILDMNIPDLLKNRIR